MLNELVRSFLVGRLLRAAVVSSLMLLAAAASAATIGNCDLPEPRAMSIHASPSWTADSGDQSALNGLVERRHS
jgi:hypothetical protein